jgi:hypothetical protein
MAEFVVYGIETELCGDPDGVDCDHAIALHAEDSDGCSHIGVSGWCECLFVPIRTGAAALLESVVAYTPAEGTS